MSSVFNKSPPPAPTSPHQIESTVSEDIENVEEIPLTEDIPSYVIITDTAINKTRSSNETVGIVPQQKPEFEFQLLEHKEIDDDKSSALAVTADANNEHEVCELCLLCGRKFTTGVTLPEDVDLLTFLCEIMNFPSIQSLLVQKKLSVQNSQFCEGCANAIVDSANILIQMRILEENLEKLREQLKGTIRSSLLKESSVSVSAETDGGLTAGPFLRKLFAQCWSKCRVEIDRVQDVHSGTSESRRVRRKRRIKINFRVEKSEKELKSEEETIQEENTLEDPDFFEPEESPEFLGKGPESDSGNALKNRDRKRKTKGSATTKQELDVEKRPEEPLKKRSRKVRLKGDELAEFEKRNANKPFLCKNCGKGYGSQTFFDAHMKTHAGELEFPCEHCDKKFSLRKYLHYHNRMTHNIANKLKKEKTKNCVYCGLDFGELNPSEPESGGKDENLAESASKTGIPSQPEEPNRLKWSEEKKIRDHVRTCPENPRNQPKDEGVEPESEGSLKKRMRMKRKYKPSMVAEFKKRNEKKPYICDECGKGYGSQKFFDAHRKTHTGPLEYACEHCDKKFSMKTYLLNHNRITHNIINRFNKQGVSNNCIYCGLDFLQDPSQPNGEDIPPKDHPPESGSVPSSEAPETEISITWSEEKRRRDHIRNCPENPRIKFQNVPANTKKPCDQCDKTFITLHALRSHIVSIHHKVFKFYCEICAAGFLIMSDLKRHIEWVHAEEKKYHCEFCESKFKTPRQLIYHRRRHTGDLPYTCEICGKSFPTSDKLKVHSFVHAEDKRFPCPDCGKLFKSSRYVYNHIYTTHKGGRKSRAKKKPSEPSSVDNTNTFIVEPVTVEIPSDSVSQTIELDAPVLYFTC